MLLAFERMEHGLDVVNRINLEGFVPNTLMFDDCHGLL
jgi:hypothetical protein